MSTLTSSSLHPSQHQEQQQQHFEVWRSDDDDDAAPSIYFVPYDYGAEQWWAVERWLWNPVLVHRMFSRHWHFSIPIVLLYVAGIHLLRLWMRHRPAFQLRSLLVLWNSALALFSFLGAWRFGQEFLYVLRHRTFQDSVCLSISPTQPVAFWAMCFALSKLAEFGDTVLLVLRKRPLIFLHWFHHAVVLIYSWHSATELTAAGRWFIQLNYMVHALMYTYYATTSAGFRPPKWVSMAVTTLQTSQMLIGVFISLYVAHLKWNNTPPSGQPLVCQQSIENMCICFAIYSAFAVLFIRFFVNAYLRQRGGQKETEKKLE